MPAAYLHDALGTVVGFLVFVLMAFAWGVPAALAAGVLAYLGAWCLRPR